MVEKVDDQNSFVLFCYDTLNEKEIKWLNERHGVKDLIKTGKINECLIKDKYS
jgi:hypothetical protein